MSLQLEVSPGGPVHGGRCDPCTPYRRETPTVACSGSKRLSEPGPPLRVTSLSRVMVNEETVSCIHRYSPGPALSFWKCSPVSTWPNPRGWGMGSAQGGAARTFRPGRSPLGRLGAPQSCSAHLALHPHCLCSHASTSVNSWGAQRLSHDPAVALRCVQSGAPLHSDFCC